MTTPNRDEALDAAAEKYAESHDPHCKWLHCPARLDAIKFFTSGAEFERGRMEARIAKLEAVVEAAKAFAYIGPSILPEHNALIEALAALDAQEEK